MSDSQYQYGCVMLDLTTPNWAPFISALIDPKDLISPTNSHKTTLEFQAHCTILYGLHQEVTIEHVYHLLSGILPTGSITIQAPQIGIFSNPEFDVVKFDVSSMFLRKANLILKTLPHTSNYPIYKPHVTIAYCKPGAGAKYQKILEKPLTLKGNRIVYSRPNAATQSFTL